MRKNVVLVMVSFLLLSTLHSRAQVMEDEPLELQQAVPANNIVKVNLPSLLLRNYSLQYERAVGKKISVGMGVRYMPEGRLPVRTIVNELIKSGELDADASNEIDKFRMGNFALTPEVRFYLGKEVLKGFYIAPFARYANFDLNFPFTIEEEDINNHSSSETIILNGNLSTLAGGIMLGAQWKLSKVIYLDWFFLGPHFGKASGTLSARKNLTPEEQDDLREQIGDLESDIPFVKFKSNVDAHGAQIKVDGPWAGIRSGLSIGFRF